MDRASDDNPRAVVAALEHLTGPSRGSATWVSEPVVDVLLTPERHLHVTGANPGAPRAGLAARLHQSGDSYEIEAPGGCLLWVNGSPVSQKRLVHGDMIEFGELGPVSRYRIYGANRPVRKSIHDIVTDCVAYLRVSRQPLGRRLLRAAGELLRELTLATTLLFRITVLGALAAFAWLGWQQYQVNLRLQESIATGAARLDTVSAALARSRDEALRPGDLSALKDELGQRLTSNIERLEALERRSQAVGRVIAESMPAVALLQGSYGFRDTESGRMLRHVVSSEGVPLISPRGNPLLTLDGEGPVAELQVIGTGFFVGDKGALVTNRHVALPWESGPGITVLEDEALEPVMTRFLAYMPGETGPVRVALLKASETADLALLGREDGEASPVAGLRLAAAPPAAGDEVVVMGYPTGLRSLLAQSGAAFIEDLQKAEDTDFWTIAARLAEKGMIVPLASRGIVGHATGEAVVYDAETTHGGSGGPVLDMTGAVVAVNSAILPEYGGSNLGVPAAKMRALLDESGM